MIRTAIRSAAFLIVFTGAARAADDESPRAVIERAIKAHGGQERLEKIKADRVTVKGKLFIRDVEGELTGETTVHLPSQFRSVVEVTFPKEKIKIVQLLNGDKAVVTKNGAPQDVVPSALTEMREILHLDRATRLTALLSDKAFELAGLGESKVMDKPVVGVKVSAKGYADILMYFDKDSGLLVKTEHELSVGEVKVKQEEYYSDFKDADGYKRPMKLVAYRAGKKLMEVETVEVKYLDKVDEKIFTKP
jgi:hypothetical protein